MSKFWSDIVSELDPYVPGEQPKITNLIKLNTNENPYGPSPRALEAMQAVANDHLRLYPDPNSDELRQAIADYYNVDLDTVFVGNGSDEVLAHTFMGLLNHDAPILFPDISYSFYPVYCGLYQIDYELVSLNEGFEIDVADYQRPNGGIIFPNPNAPTGIGMELEAIERLLKANPDSVVVVDEAYVDFGGATAVPLTERYDNLLVIQTFSKSRSLAGLRAGFAIGEKVLIDGLNRVKNSFNSYPMDRFAIAGGKAAMEDQNYFAETVGRIILSREILSAELQQLGFKVLPSQANFVFTTHPDHDAAKLAEQLRERSIIVRYFNKARIDQYLRITIGTPEECEALVTALKEILGKV